MNASLLAPPEAPDSVALANRLRPVLLQLARHLRREVLHAAGVTAGQASVLAAVAGQPGIGVGELAHREGLSAPSVVAHLDRLEAMGLVERARGVGAGASDRRRVGLTATAEGSRVLRAIRRRRTAWLASRLRRLDGDEVAALQAAVAPLSRLLEDSR